MFPLIVVGIVEVLLSTTRGFDYCNIHCNTTKHTLCEFQPGGGPNCQQNEQVYLSLEEKRWILELHNNFRQNVAEGRELRGKKGKQPQAGNMMRLAWDWEVAEIAKRWADQCHASAHDECRKTMDGKRLSQNSAIGEYQYEGADTEGQRYNRIKQIIQSWEDEVVDFDPKLIRDYIPELAGNTSHYTQLVWANTRFLGCGYTEFRMDNNVVKYRFICDYKPRGNMPYEAIYRPGAPCSSCAPRYNCSQTWDHLCWDGSISIYTPTSPASESSAFKTIRMPNLMVLLCAYLVMSLYLVLTGRLTEI